MEATTPSNSLSGDRARNYLLRILGLREYSSKELRTKLKEKGASPETIDQLITRFIDLDLINDTRFANAFVRSQMTKKRGIRLIRQHLRMKGITDDMADEALSQVDETAAIQALIASKYSRLDLTDPKQKQRLYAALARRGFPSNLILETLQ